MHALQSRMRYLRNGETIAAIAIPIVAVLRWRQSADAVLWELRMAALVLVCYILLQGVLYWHLKLRSLDGRGPLPAWFAALFRRFKWSNVVGIGAVLAALLACQSTASRADLEWAGGLLLMAGLEQINYYHYQLMYDTRAALAHLRRTRRLRKAALALDMARG
jgi:hypothetical protein